MINCSGKILDLSQPQIMGILNLTPDSFYDGGHYSDVSVQLRQAEKMIAEGAGILDLGAVSTRPGATEPTEKEELERLLPALKEIRRAFPTAPISVDTYRSNVAKIAIEEGADIINDIYAGSYDGKMFSEIAHYKVPYIVMHMLGTPSNMQEKPFYKNVVKEILFFFSEKIKQLRQLGVADVIIDPGFGFGKTLTHNYTILSKLEYFSILGLPLLIGVSRKSMACKPLHITPDKALNATTVLHTLALNKGAHILRVHDVKEAAEVVKLLALMK